MEPSDLDRLEGLVRSGRALVTIRTFEEWEALQLVRDTAIRRAADLRVWTSLSGVYDGLLDGSGPVAETLRPSAALQHLGYSDRSGLVCLVDLGDHLGEAGVLRGLRDLVTACRGRGATVVMIDHAAELPSVVRAHASEFELSLPGAEAIERSIRSVAQRVHRQSPLKVDLSRDTLDTMVRNLRGLPLRRIEEIVREIALGDRRIDGADLERVIALKREMVRSGGLLEFVRAPTSMDEVGGMDRLKRWLAVREGALDSAVDPPRGVLLLGVQGAGKSLCAKAIATAWRRPLLRMDAGALYDRYVGESERRLRDTLHQAERMAPCVLWIDEIEKAFASAAGQSSDGGLSRRMFGSLLTWMQEHREPVFLVATANDIDALPPELLRKGRFDEIFFVDLPGAESRRAILSIHLRRRGLEPGSLDLGALVEVTAGYSGAEIEQAVIAAGHEARASGVGVSTGSLLSAAAQSPPLSVTMREKVEALRAWSVGRCVPAE
jgi:AAA+ superfamily predicted ATPase